MDIPGTWIMNANPQLMTAVEQLGYRVTCGDVVTHTGIHLESARSGLLALANQTGGHLQVTDTGEVIYVLSPDFRQILIRKSVQLQFQAWLDRFFTVAFYLIKISFGILLIASVSVVYLTILAITLAALFGSEGGGDCGDCGDGGGSCVLGIFDWGGSSSSSLTTMTTTTNENLAPVRAKTQRKPLNFLEAVFSVLFGDGNPNADLEQRRWSYISNLIHRQQGVAIGEQIAPYLDNIGQGFDLEYENYMLPVLTKFNGIPEVSPTGQLVYHFPDLQSTLKDTSGKSARVPKSLKERKWKFTKATPTQTNWSIVLFAANLIGISILAVMISGATSGLIGGAMPVLAFYGIGLVAIPFCRYFWVKYQDRQVRRRNQLRRQQVNLLKQEESIQQKLDYAKQFAKQYKITDRDIIYTTEEDALSQEFKRLE
ncbi:hypothetical protein [Chamaesiphon sp. VAR_48_metabat_135_sub]|uniref:hypothetical protein n=1 Tax=Chamaesiphon sp. VAR_48_metabat_135_sub TaxID=2964699 RepID=UPI00286CE6B2|nr:hypothetical protein [Chamaesiphon sp. VAR_48_metabat_135_sub]